ncbi:hypothetical protein U1Q18_050000, partial [Sarracenia purpurea var. burkii]
HSTTASASARIGKRSVLFQNRLLAPKRYISKERSLLDGEILAALFNMPAYPTYHMVLPELFNPSTYLPNLLRINFIDSAASSVLSALPAAYTR